MNINKHLRKRNSKSGFTMMELLIIVAIIILICSVSVFGMMELRHTLKQKELDSKAEIIYSAAQNRLTKLKSLGKNSVLSESDSVKSLGFIPSDVKDDTIEEGTLYFEESKNNDKPMVLPKSYVDYSLWSQNWVVEFDPVSGSVYSVFYSEEEIDYAADKDSFDELREKKVRRKICTVGYYGGGTLANAGEIKKGLHPVVQQVNGEQLKVWFYCKSPDGTELDYTVELSQKSDDGQNTIIKKVTSGKKKIISDEIILDDLLREETRFNSLYPDFDPAADVDVVFTVSLNKKNAGEDGKDSKTTKVKSIVVNPLFADAVDNNNDGKPETAIITFARHLQNLDSSSGVPEYITKAIQKSNLQFGEISEDKNKEKENNSNLDSECWFNLYGENSFKPIDNENLSEYNGSFSTKNSEAVAHTTITDLSIAGTDKKPLGNAALFAKFEGKIENVALTATNIKASDAAGALIAEVTGTVELDNCKTYLNPAKGQTQNRPADLPCVNAKTVGGLIGTVANGGKAIIKNSFAANVIGDYNTNVAGGLIGEVSGTAIIEKSYADSYIYGKNTSGLVGRSTGKTELKNCYAAGFEYATNHACGLVNGDVDKAENVYTAVDYDGMEPKYATFESKNQPAYYLNGPEGDYKFVDREDLLKNLGGEKGAFTSQTGGNNTVAYNLKRQGLTDYSYAKLDDIVHYGDWAARFESGSMVYFEKYSDGTVGFFGGNKDLLCDKEVVEDNYKVIYSSNIKGTTEITASDGKKYYMANLPKSEKTKDEGIKSVYDKVIIGKDVHNEDIIYWYNPDLAKSQTKLADITENDMPYNMYIRSARQLNALSENYDNYYDLIKIRNEYYHENDKQRTTFYQECDINYDAYHFDKKPNNQKPIGNSNNAFIADYDGGYNEISGISFYTDDKYSGFIGYNEGTLKNIVLNSPNSVGIKAVSSGIKAAVGAVVGYNDGRIENCAAADYEISVMLSRNGTAYIGGLVGNNSGTVKNSEASIPKMIMDTNYSYVYAGGFVGLNSGVIDSCYGISNIKVESGKSEGRINLSGFAGDNPGIIRHSYCESALNTAGSAIAYGFTPKGGYTTDCYYLSGGTYLFKEHIYPYLFESSVTDGTAKNIDDLQGMTLSGFGRTSIYPYAAIVENENGYVHYGDWVKKPEMGSIGVFYWEHEEGGSNEGYHLSCLGTNGDRISSLCEAHNDDGVITDYGYGYYYQTNKPAVVMDGLIINTDGTVSAEFGEQISGYTFVTFTSGTDLSLDGNRRNGEMSLNGTKYYISPYFANAMSLSDNLGSNSDNEYEIRSAAQLQYLNWNCDKKNSVTVVTNNNYKNYPYLTYATVTGTGKQTSAAAQQKTPVMYWNQTHDVDGCGTRFAPIAGTSVTSSLDVEEDKESFLGALFNWLMPKEIREFFDRIEKVVKDDNKVNLYAWFGGQYDGQNYTIKNLNIKADNLMNVGLFGTTVGAGLKNIVMYSDMEDISVTRESKIDDYAGGYAIGGLVGIAYEYPDVQGTASQNEIANCAIAGYTINDESKNELGMTGANIGGLIGISNVNLHNCSAVTKINVNCEHIDERGDIRTFGDGNNIRVGGIAGSCKFTMTNCYSGGKITIGEELLTETGKYNAVDGTLISKKLFTRGSREKISANAKSNDRASTVYSTHVFVGGLGGSGFSSNYVNFNGGENKADAAPAYYNCYTYMKLPKIEGTIRTVSLIGSVADRFRDLKKNTKMIVDNCYYLDTIKKNLSKDTAPKFYFRSLQDGSFISTIFKALTRNYINYQDLDLNKILEGNIGNVLNDYIGFSNVLEYFTEHNGDYDVAIINGLDALSYEDMSKQGFIDALNSEGTVKNDANSFIAVTTEEYGINVSGKYSFPGANRALRGKDYPFPTILTQPNAFGDGVNVHYGEWPLNGMYWEDGIAELDLIANYDEFTARSHKKLKLYVDDYKGGMPVIKIYKELENVESSDVVRIIKQGTEQSICVYDEENECYVVDVEGMNVGAARIVAEYGGYKAECVLDVTAEIKVTAEPMDTLLYIGDQNEIELTAFAGDKDLTGNPECRWTVTSENETIAAVSDVKYNTDSRKRILTLSGMSEGEARIFVDAQYKLGNNIITGSIIIAATVHRDSILGLANILAEPKAYNEITIPHTLTNTEYLGLDKTYGQYEISPMNDDGAIFVYGSGTDMHLSDYSMDVSVKSVATDETEAVVVNGVKQQDISYDVFIRDIVSDHNFEYIPLTITSGTAGTYTVIVTLHKNNIAYRMQTNCYVEAKTFTGTFHESKESEKVVTQIVPYGGKPDITKVDFSTFIPIITPTGYREVTYMTGIWKTLEGKGLNDRIYQDTDYYLDAITFAPIEYQVRYHISETASVVSDVFKYDMEYEAKSLDDEIGREFLGWSVVNGSTKADFKDKIKNLTTEDNKIVDVWSVWNNLYVKGIFNLNGVGTNITNDYIKGSNIDLSKIEIEHSDQFDKWICGTKEYAKTDIYQNIMEDTEFIAKWKSYRVTHTYSNLTYKESNETTATYGTDYTATYSTRLLGDIIPSKPNLSVRVGNTNITDLVTVTYDTHKGGLFNLTTYYDAVNVTIPGDKITGNITITVW